MAFHVSYIALLIVIVSHYSIGAPFSDDGRRGRDIIVYMPKKNVIGPAYGHSVYGGQEINNSRPPPSESSDNPEDDTNQGDDEFGRRSLDSHINQPKSYAPYGQQFYHGDNVHNAPVAYAVMGSGFGRRAQDIIIYKPGKNIVGPAYGESFYGGQFVKNSKPSEGVFGEEESRRSAGLGLGSGRRDQDIIVYRPYTNIIGPPYAQSVYGSQNIKEESDVPDKKQARFPKQ